MKTRLPKPGKFDYTRSMEEDMNVWRCPYCNEEHIIELDYEGSISCQNCGEFFRVADACCVDLIRGEKWNH